ncbi:MAG: heavy-metal-associated domain-containing protein [bacterium]
MRKLTLLLAGVLLFNFVLLTSAPAQVEKVTIRVDGLSCPFCAYGLEKKLKSIEGVKDVKINVDKGVATLQSKKEESIGVEKLESVVKDAGFTPREITVTIVGKLGQSDVTPIFSTDGSEVKFILKENEQLQKLLSDLKGSEKLVRITGFLAHETPEGHHAHPFTFTIEKFEVIQ